MYPDREREGQTRGNGCAIILRVWLTEEDRHAGPDAHLRNGAADGRSTVARATAPHLLITSHRTPWLAASSSPGAAGEDETHGCLRGGT